MKKHRFTSAVVNLFFPRRCPFCDAVLGFAPTCRCDKERASLIFEKEKVLLEKGGARLDAYAVYHYHGAAQRAILQLKMSGQKQRAKALADDMAALLQKHAVFQSIDAVVPVPVSEGTLRRRGYNQSALLAERICGALSLPLYDDVLIKTKETAPQMQLSKEERKTNLAGAYQLKNKEQLSGKRILLIDDVLTTGSTLLECAETLYQADVKACFGLCAAVVE